MWPRASGHHFLAGTLSHMCYSTWIVTISAHTLLLLGCCCTWSLRSSRLTVMSFPPPEKVSCKQFVGILARLQHLLENLPVQLHCPTNESESHYYSFLPFSLDPNILEKTGDEIATLGEQLEHVFGWKAHTSGDCILPILERGKAQTWWSPGSIPPFVEIKRLKHLSTWYKLANGMESMRWVDSVQAVVTWKGHLTVMTYSSEQRFKCKAEVSASSQIPKHWGRCTTCCAGGLW